MTLRIRFLRTDRLTDPYALCMAGGRPCFRFQRARLAHTRGVQGESYKQMKLGQLTSPLGIWVREFAIRSIPGSVLQKKLRAANVFEVDSWLQRFRAVRARRAKDRP